MSDNPMPPCPLFRAKCVEAALQLVMNADVAEKQKTLQAEITSKVEAMSFMMPDPQQQAMHRQAQAQQLISEAPVIFPAPSAGTVRAALTMPFMEEAMKCIGDQCPWCEGVELIWDKDANSFDTKVKCNGGSCVATAE
jgi:hypothetical protein